MNDVQVDLADDRFDLRYDPTRVSPEAMLAAVRGLGYEPELVEGARELPPAKSSHVEPSSLPEEIRASFHRAAREDRPVLLDFWSPG